jgi:hypothetical protein
LNARESLRSALEELSALPVPEPDLSECNDPWQLTGANHWYQIDPKEDLVVVPELEWPDGLKRLALAAYEERFAQYLENCQYYVLVWPPSGSLWSGGDWGYRDVGECEEHEADEPDHGCEQCAAVTTAQTEDARVCYDLAEWHWELEVQTWQRERRPDGQFLLYQVFDDEDVRDTWFLGGTTQLPWELWFDA